MVETKTRLTAISTILTQLKRSELAGFVAAESCYLQLRMISELIALTCLLAHDDIEITRTPKMIGLEYPDQILKTLGQLHNDFYPSPVRFVLPDKKSPASIKTAPQVIAIPVTESFLTKQDLIDLYGVCGNALHRGSLKSVLAGPKILDIDNIESWHKRIWSLLLDHQIALSDCTTVLWCTLRDPLDAEVSVSIYARHLSA